MAKPDYKEFDRVLLESIQARRNTMMLLDGEASGLRPLAAPHQTKARYGKETPTFRIIDRRLQALRKAGKLRWTDKVWEIAPK
jgi:hypothetical protein